MRNMKDCNSKALKLENFPKEKSSCFLEGNNKNHHLTTVMVFITAVIPCVNPCQRSFSNILYTSSIAMEASAT